MAIKFVKEQFSLEDLKDRGVIVVDTNLQGLWEFGDLKLMQYAFPKIYAYYQKICKNPDLVKPGRCLLLEEDGYKVALLIAKRNRKEDLQTASAQFEEAVKDLLRIVPSDVFIYSPILGRYDKYFGTYATIINKLIRPELRNWFVYTKKGL